MMVTPQVKFALRVACALFLVAIIGDYLQVDKLYWIILTVLVVMQSTLGATLDRSRSRAVSTLTGVVVGGIVMSLLADQIALLLIISLLIAFVGLYFMFYNMSRAIFCLSAVLIIALGFMQHNVWYFAEQRFINTCVGIVVAFIFSMCVFPLWAKKNIHTSLLQVLEHLQQLTPLMMAAQEQETLFADIESRRALLIRATEKLKKDFTELRYELISGNAELFIFESIILLIYRLRVDLYFMFDARADIQSKDSFKELAAYAQDIFSTLCKAVLNRQSPGAVHVYAQPAQESAYISQAVRLFIADLSALQQDMHYLYRATV